MELRELLGRQVDVVTERGIYWLLRRRILKEARPLWRVVDVELPKHRAAIAAVLPPLDQLEGEIAGEDESPEGDRP